MARLTNFPHITPTEFNTAITQLHSLSSKLPKSQTQRSAWQSVDLHSHEDGDYLTITKTLATLTPSQPSTAKPPEPHLSHATQDLDPDISDTEFDAEALPTSPPLPTLIYTIHYSHSYSMPVLYFHIHDPSLRYPPTPTTLYTHIIAPTFRAQAEIAGVMGGVTMTDHPVTGAPVWFIHPCRTAEVLEASVEVGRGEEVGVLGYLVRWIGAMGACVGLSVPVCVALALGENGVKPGEGKGESMRG